MAEGRKARTAIAGDGAVESDRPGRRGGADETVEDRILTGTIKFERVAGRQKVDRSAGRRAIGRGPVYHRLRARHFDLRSDEHTSELQSLMRIPYAVFCLKKTTKQN